jgi:MIP family channel proteins
MQPGFLRQGGQRLDGLLFFHISIIIEITFGMQCRRLAVVWTTVMRKLAAEMIGTFALVFAGTGAITINDVSHGAVTHVGIALTFGLIVMAMIYAVGDVSGAHLNPAVTIAFWVARRFEGRFVAPYIGSQLAGALAASVCLRFLFREHPTLGTTIPAGPWSQSFVLEFLLSALLMFVILGVSMGAKENGVMAGAAVGATVALEAMFAGPICGASMNPARSVAPALVSGQVDDLWIYLAAPTLGAAFAVAGWRCVRPEETIGSPVNSPTEEFRP